MSAVIVEIDKKFYGPFPSDADAKAWVILHPAKPVIAYTHPLRAPMSVHDVAGHQRCADCGGTYCTCSQRGDFENVRDWR